MTAQPHQPACPTKVTGTVTIDLTKIKLDSRDAVSTAKATLWAALSDTPAGAEVRLVVPGWQWWCSFTAAAFADMAEHVGGVVVESRDPRAVRNWVLALRQEIRPLDSVMDR